MTPRIVRDIEKAGPGLGPCALSIGNFDGVHAGHRLILRRVAALGSEHGWKASVLTFDPHPARILAASRAPRLLSRVPERASRMGQQGIQQVIVVPFDLDFALLTPEEFVDGILVGKLDARAVVVGENFRFGREHRGDIKALKELGSRHGLVVEAVPAVRVRGHKVSSSAIRRLLEAGNVSRAGRMLERPYAVSGEVIPGYGIGSRRTVPTLNLATQAEVIPARGVYITRTEEVASGRLYPSVTNVGIRPTFGGHALTIETHLIESIGFQAPARIRVEFLYRLRAEQKFSNPEDLKAQILRDVVRAQAYFRRLPALA
jgi:riboflavin kinase/FMN adenylyltransferase